MMKTTLTLLGLSLVASCGDDAPKKTPDAAVQIDAAKDIDAPPAPPPPTLGAQVDRMGRPAINTALNNTFLPDDSLAKKAAKDGYNTNSDPSTWGSSMVPMAASPHTFLQEFAANLAIIDALDTTATSNGCGNQALYNGMLNGGGTPMANSYYGLAGILADDELYVDTSKGSCGLYLSVEFDAASGGQVPHTQCGGRAPTHDVLDVSYSLLAFGVGGFDIANNFDPIVKDGATVHADLSDTNFPFLGPPHQ